MSDDANNILPPQPQNEKSPLISNGPQPRSTFSIFSRFEGFPFIKLIAIFLALVSTIAIFSFIIKYVFFSYSERSKASLDTNFSKNYLCADPRYGVAGTFPRSDFLSLGLSANAGNYSYTVGAIDSTVETLRGCHADDNDARNPMGCFDKRTMTPESQDFIIRNQTALEKYVRDHPGRNWTVENEPNVPGSMDHYITTNNNPINGLHPEQYAKVYHRYYQLIKGIDPTAKFAIGSLINADMLVTDGCLTTDPTACPERNATGSNQPPAHVSKFYLPALVTAYRRLFNETIPSDFFMLHHYHNVRWLCSNTGNDPFYPSLITDQVAFLAEKEGIRRLIDLYKGLQDGIYPVYNGQKFWLTEWGYLNNGKTPKTPGPENKDYFDAIGAIRYIEPKENGACMANYVKRTVQWLETPESGIDRWMYFFGPNKNVREAPYCGHHYLTSDPNIASSYLDWPCWSGWLYTKDSSGIHLTEVGEAYVQEAQKSCSAPLMPKYWGRKININRNDVLDTSVKHGGTYSFRITPNSQKKDKYLMQTNISYNGSAGDVIEFSAWNKIDQRYLPASEKINAALQVKYTDGTSRWIDLIASSTTHDWELKTGSITVKKPYQSILVSLHNRTTDSTVWFDDMSIRITPSTSVTSPSSSSILQNGDFEIADGK